MKISKLMIENIRNMYPRQIDVIILKSTTFITIPNDNQINDAGTI